MEIASNCYSSRSKPSRFLVDRLVSVFLPLTLAHILTLAPVFALESSWKVSLVEGERRLTRKEYPAAEDCFRQAMKEARRSQATPDEIVLCMESLAHVLQIEDLTEDSVPLYRKALRVLERKHGKNSEKLLPVLLALGEIQEAEGNFKAAIAYYSRSDLIVSKASGTQNLVYADCQHRLGRARAKAHMGALAESNYRAALLIIMAQPDLAGTGELEALLADYGKLLRNLYGEGRPLACAFQGELWRDRVGAQTRKAAVKDSQFEREVSVKLAEQANSRANSREDLNNNSKSNQGSQSPALPLRGLDDDRLFPQGASAEVFRRAPAGAAAAPSSALSAASGSAVLAEINRQRLEFYQRMVAIDIKALGGDHPSVARDLSGLAAIYLSCNRYGEAKPLLERARTIYQGTYGEDSLLYRRTEDMLSLVEAGQGAPERTPISLDFVKALPAVPRQARVLEVALRLNDLAFLTYSLGKLDEAETLYHYALACTASACGDDSLLTASCLRDYSRVLRGLGRDQQASAIEKDAELIARNARPQSLSR